jgi:adenylate cyclase
VTRRCAAGSVAVTRRCAAGVAANAPPRREPPAVLPFENLSGDPKQERLAGGPTEDVITELSRFRELFVIAPEFD